ncbi:hypothetical protein [Mycobacterium sp. AT1]|nr:hypothetical protein [Mycobacterium sp. AT1]
MAGFDSYAIGTGWSIRVVAARTTRVRQRATIAPSQDQIYAGTHL